MTGLLLAALLAQDGGVEQLYAKCADAPLLVPMDGGFWEPMARQQRQNCKLAACESYARSRLAEPQASGEASPGLVLGLVGGGLALVALAFLLGYEVHTH